MSGIAFYIFLIQTEKKFKNTDKKMPEIYDFPAKMNITHIEM